MMNRKFPTKWNAEKQRWDDPPTVDCSADLKAGRHAVQSDRDSVDINKIMERVLQGGTIPEVNGQPFYGDVSDFTGLADAIIKVQESNELFMQYPAKIRERFDNDPVKFVDFLSDEANLKEAVDLGLALPRPEVPVPPVPDPEQGQ